MHCKFIVNIFTKIYEIIYLNSMCEFRKNIQGSRLKCMHFNIKSFIKRRHNCRSILLVYISHTDNLDAACIKACIIIQYQLRVSMDFHPWTFVSTYRLQIIFIDHSCSIIIRQILLSLLTSCCYEPLQLYNIIVIRWLIRYILQTGIIKFNISHSYLTPLNTIT